MYIPYSNFMIFKNIQMSYMVAFDNAAANYTEVKRNVAYEIRHYFKIIEIFTFAYGMAVMYKGKAAHV